MMRLKKPIVLASAAVMLTLSACGGGGGDEGAKLDEGPNQDNAELETSGGDTGNAVDMSAKGPVVVEGAKEGGTVNVVSADGFNKIDPTNVYYTNTGSIMSGMVFRSLTQLIEDPETGGVKVVPDLATKWEYSKDYKTWTFWIRDGVKWGENGKEITPEEIRYGMLRSFDEATFIEGPTFSRDFFLDADKYKGPYKSGTDYKGITVEGNKIIIKMERPFPYMHFWGTFAAMGPVPMDESISDPAKYNLKPWSTGPYMVQEHTPEQSMTLVRNPHWDPATDPGRTAYPDKYVFDFQTASDKIDQMMLEDSGSAQTTLTFDNVQGANYGTAKAEASDRLAIGTTPCTYYWAPDYRKVTDINVRKAMAWAYPYQQAWVAGGEIPGVTRVLNERTGSNLMAPGLPGREPYNTLPDHPVAATDTAKAKELLKEAGAEGFEVSWLYAKDDPISVKAKDAVAASLEEAGFTTKPVATTTAEFSTLREDPNAPVNVRTGGWCSDWPSGSSWIPPLLETTNLDTQGVGANYTIFSEPEVDKKIDEIYGLPLEEQDAAWQKLEEEIFNEYFPLVNTGYSGAAMMAGSKIEGFEADVTNGMPNWSQIWVNQ